MVIQKSEPYPTITKSNQFDDLEDIGEIKENGLQNAYFSDNEDYVDDITDQELLSDLLAQRPKPPEKFDSLVIVDNIPIVGKEKINKLKDALRKKFSSAGPIINEFYPVNEDGTTKGYMFLEYESDKCANKAIALLDGHHLDKAHILRVNGFGDIEKYENFNENSEPQLLSYKEIDNLYDWLLQVDGNDQFMVLAENENHESLLSIYLNIITGPQLIIEKEKWSDKKAFWSPQGTYLVTYHPKGVALYGTANFDQIKRFTHPNVEYVFFSPCERYFISYSSKQTSIGEPLILWEVLSGAKAKVFTYNATPMCLDQPFWPPFKWSYDGTYFARISAPDTLAIYNIQTYALIDKTPMIIKDIVDFEWSTHANMLSYWVHERQEIPAKLCIMNVPDRTDVRPASTLGTTVTQCRMLWTDLYLAVLSDRYAKKKVTPEGVKYSGLSYAFEIFHIRQSEVPKDTIEFKNKIVHFQPEPKGNKIGIIAENKGARSVYLYEVNSGGKPPTLLLELSMRKFNRLFWCPNGQFLVIAELGSRSDSGDLLFLDTKDMTRMAEVSHPHVDLVKWDFTGRFVATAVTLNYQRENAFRIWTFQGKQLNHTPCIRLRDFDWRPRLKASMEILTDQEVKEIQRGLKKFSAVFDTADKALYTQAAKEVTEKRKKEKEDFEVYLDSKISKQEKIKEARLALVKDSDKLEEEVYEILQSEETQPAPKI